MNDLILYTTDVGETQIELNADLFPISVVKDSLTTDPHVKCQGILNGSNFAVSRVATTEKSSAVHSGLRETK